MKTWMMRSAVLAAVVGLSSLGYEAVAGFRHLRMFRSSCAAPSCSIPSSGCWGPSWGCSAPVGCHSPMMSCSGPACSGPVYVTLPMVTVACSAPACSAPMCGSPTYFSPGYPGVGFGGYDTAMSFDPAYQAAPAFGAAGPALAPQWGGPFGGPSLSGSHVLPAYYAPMSAQYAPLPPAPAADIVW